MLTADQINALGDKAQQITSPIVDFLIEDIARRISEAGQLTSTASYLVWRLQQLGMSQKQVMREIQKRLNVSIGEAEKLMTQAAEVGYDFDIRNLPHTNAVPFAKNTVVQDFVNAAVEMAREDLTNMVQTIGFVGPNGQALPLTQAYEQTCDFAFQKVATGAQDYNSAIRDATRELADKGIVTIDYASGRHRSLEAAVRGNIMGALGTMQEKISQQNHDDLGCDGWEISAHAASAPDHEPIQGKQYSDEEFEKLNNSLVRRIGTLNCGHAAFPIILGVNSPQYTDAELEQFRQDNEKGINYEGKHYTNYEATQRQRKLERAIRDRKRRTLIDEATGDKEQLANDQTKLTRLNDEYARFTKAAGLRSQRERAQIAGFGQKKPEKATDPFSIEERKKKLSTVQASSVLEAVEIARQKGVRYPRFDKMDIEQVNNILNAVDTLPDDCKPAMIANGKDISTATGRPLGRKADQWWGVTYDYRCYSLRTMQLGYEKTDYDGGQLVGFNTSKYKGLGALTKAKEANNERYFSKTGHYWSFNTDGRATAYHEFGHCFVNVRGLPKNWEALSEKWAAGSKCDILKKPDEAFAEAWAAFHMADERLPDYIYDAILEVIGGK